MPDKYDLNALIYILRRDIQPSAHSRLSSDGAREALAAKLATLATTVQ